MGTCSDRALSSPPAPMGSFGKIVPAASPATMAAMMIEICLTI
jgi:hypothetical protein